MENASVLIFIVEDEGLLQLVLEEALVEAGFAVCQAFDGEKALRVLDARAAEISVLITDINLGSKITGWDVARRARHLISELPVIYTTSVSSSDWTSMSVPKSVLLTKPYTSAQVVMAVSQLINAAS